MTGSILQESVHERAREAAVDDAEEEEQPEAERRCPRRQSADEGGLARTQRTCSEPRAIGTPIRAALMTRPPLDRVLPHLGAAPPRRGVRRRSGGSRCLTQHQGSLERRCSTLLLPRTQTVGAVQRARGARPTAARRARQTRRGCPNRAPAYQQRARAALAPLGDGRVDHHVGHRDIEIDAEKEQRRQPVAHCIAGQHGEQRVAVTPTAPAISKYACGRPPRATMEAAEDGLELPRYVKKPLRWSSRRSTSQQSRAGSTSARRPRAAARFLG